MARSQPSSSGPPAAVRPSSASSPSPSADSSAAVASAASVLRLWPRQSQSTPPAAARRAARAAEGCWRTVTDTAPSSRASNTSSTNSSSLSHPCWVSPLSASPAALPPLLLPCTVQPATRVRAGRAAAAPSHPSASPHSDVPSVAATVRCAAHRSGASSPTDISRATGLQLSSRAGPPCAPRGASTASRAAAISASMCSVRSGATPAPAWQHNIPARSRKQRRKPEHEHGNAVHWPSASAVQRHNTAGCILGELGERCGRLLRTHVLQRPGPVPGDQGAAPAAPPRRQ